MWKVDRWIVPWLSLLLVSSIIRIMRRTKLLTKFLATYSPSWTAPTSAMRGLLAWKRISGWWELTTTTL